MTLSSPLRDRFHFDRVNLFFWVIVAILFIVRITTWSGYVSPIVAYPHDDLLYLKLAKGSYWGYEYDYLAFVRRPGFPLFIAGCKFFGIPFSTAIKGLYCIAVFLLGFAFKKLRAPNPLVLLGISLGLFHPSALSIILRITPDGFYSICALLALALVGLWIYSKNRTTKLILAILIGINIGTIVITRDEQIVAIGFLALLTAGFVFFKTRGITKLRHSLIPCIASYSLIVSSILIVNKVHFGIFSISEFSSNGFHSVYQAALSVTPEEKFKGVPITQNGLERVFEVSPTWNQMADSIRSSYRSWSRLTTGFTKAEGELGAGGFPWMLKDAVNKSGHYKNAQQADSYYQTLADEIRSAQEAGLLEKRGPILSQIDPDWKRWYPDFLISLGRILSETIHPTKVLTPQTSGQNGAYQEIAKLYRETLSLPPKSPPFFITKATISGWVFKSHGEIKSIEVKTADNRTIQKFSNFHERTDVSKARARFKPQLNSGISIDWDFDTIDANQAEVVFNTADGNSTSISLSRFLRKGNGRVANNSHAEIRFFIDSLELDAARDSSTLSTHKERVAYSTGFILLIITSVAYSIFRFKNHRIDPKCFILLLLIVSWFLARLLVGALLDATAFPCEPRAAFSAFLTAPWILVAIPCIWREFKTQ